MSLECSWLISCPFFQKHKSLGDEKTERLKQLYCKGPYMEQCVRKIYKELHGKHADDRMTPEGEILEVP